MDIRRSLLSHLSLLAAISCLSAAHAGNLSISNVPLGTGSGITVKPNLLFILDDSGSMDSEYMPDAVADNQMCPDSNNDGDADDGCVVGDPPYSANGFNRIYYNPAIRYYPPKNADGTDWANASKTEPKKSPFSTSTSTQTLTSYQNTAWCKLSTNTPTGNPATDANCVYYPVGTASNYPLYPNATYKYRKTYSGPPVYYVMSGAPQWCNSSSLTSCQLRWSNTYKWPKFGVAAETIGVQAYRSFHVLQAGNTSGAKNIDITYNGTSILSSPVAVNYNSNSKNNRNDLADKIVNAINGSASGFVATLMQSDTSTGSSTCGSSNTSKCAQIKVTAPGGPAATTNAGYNGKSFNLGEPTGIDFKNATDDLANGVDYSPASTGVSFTRYQIVSGQTYTKYSGRSDCTGASCTYDEELQNFANWYSFYRKRMHLMKSSVSRAFASISDSAPGAGFRVGFDNICNSSTNVELEVGDFTTTHKTNFYTKLFAASTSCWTPLRGALSKAGRLYAGQLASDPVQFSCQQNFTFLTTDGYWNTNAESASYGPKMENGSTNVGDQDATAEPPYRDALSKSDTLADVAMYYWKTDLRSSMANDVPTSARDDASHQHMVTFTMGMGVDGTLQYSPDYETGGSADYIGILQSTKYWPDPIANTEAERIDDLWHAAVNGRGKYFSASDPQTVTDSLTSALSGVSAMTGSSAAAATSNLEPVAGDNYAYVASYVTQTWEGNLEAKEIDLTTGMLSSASVWTARDLLDALAQVSPVPAGASGPGGRKLYSYNPASVGTDKKFLLTWANAQARGWDGSVAGKDYFDPTRLPQCNPITSCPGATRQNLFEYLMGGPDTTTNGSYRTRSHVLGDIVNAQPVYVKAPSFGYTDDGYATYKSTSRKAMVYVGSNDGFLHAFDATSETTKGNEDWAYMPSLVTPSLYELGASNYTHRYFVDGVITVGDVKIGAGWKTILVGGLGGGGKGYYALDVTDPAAPLALWEFTDARLGYSYGNPIVTKMPAGSTSSSGSDIGGKWVVLLTSGYNNGTSIGSHDGQGILYVLDAYTGTEYLRLYTCTNQASDATCAGSTASPNGLAKVNNWVNDPTHDNTTLYVYGGDLEGNLWRFDLAAKTAFKMAEIGEPITVKPELAEVQGKRVVYFGTGLFLQATDKADTTRRSIYAVRDDPAATGPLQNVKTAGDLVEQTMATVAGVSTARTIDDPQPVDWNAKRGWFVELLEDRERVNVDPKIQLGTLVVASNVPDDTGAAACTTGGHSWLNFLDITTGSFVVNTQSNAGGYASVKLGSALAVGINIVKLPNGKLVTITTTSDNQHPVKETPVGSANLPLKRISWRELVTD